MLRRYAHMAADHLTEYAEQLTWPRAIESTNLAHRQGMQRTPHLREYWNRRPP